MGWMDGTIGWQLLVAPGARADTEGMAEDLKTDIDHARVLNVESQAEFADAHARGMEDLKNGDTRGLLESIDDELEAILKQRRCVELLNTAVKKSGGTVAR